MKSASFVMVEAFSMTPKSCIQARVRARALLSTHHNATRTSRHTRTGVRLAHERTHTKMCSSFGQKSARTSAHARGRTHRTHTAKYACTHPQGTRALMPTRLSTSTFTQACMSALSNCSCVRTPALKCMKFQLRSRESDSCGLCTGQCRPIRRWLLTISRARCDSTGHNMPRCSSESDVR